MIVKKSISEHFRNLLIINIFFILSLLQSCATVQVIPDKIFHGISNYHYGDDRTNLTTFSHLVDSLSLNKETKKLAEENILDFLNSNATFASKQFVCRKLRLIGTEKSVPTLSKLLNKRKTTNIARYALENIQGNKVDKALINSLDNPDKKIKIGIINTLAARKTKNSVYALGELLQNADNDIAIAAASALGKIADKKAMAFLEKHFNSANINFRNTLFDSYLLCIDNIAKQDKYEAYIYYTKFYKLDLPTNLKSAALNGIINTAKNKKEEILIRIKNEPTELKSIAISKIRELPESTDITVYAELLKTLPPENQIQLLSVFEDRKDKSVKPNVIQLLNSDIDNVKIAVVKTLANIGDKTDIIKLAKISANNNNELSKHAFTSLSLLKGNDIDKTIISLIPKVKDDLKIVLIKAVGARIIKPAFATILKFTNSGSKKLMSETFKSLAEISTEKNLQELLSLFSNLDNIKNKKKLERTISKVLINYPNKQNTALLAKAKDSTNDISTKSSLLRLLGYTNDNNALNLLKKEAANKNLTIREAAVQGLANFTTSEPMNDLMEIMISEKNKKIKSIALKGFVHSVNINKTLGACDKVNLYNKALPFAQTSNERNLVLDGIGHSDCFESLEVIKPYINQPDVKGTVDDCINRVSWHLHQKNPERIKDYVNWFLSKIKDEKFQKKNKFLLDVIDKFIKNRDANLR